MRCAFRVVMVLALCGPVAAPQEGDEKISIHISDTLENITALLREQHSLSIGYGERLHDKFVELDLEDASALEVVTAICKQVGAVYEGGPRARWWILRAGDWDADARPQVALDGYVVYVESVTKHQSQRLDFRWGQEEGEPTLSDYLSVTLGVEPRTEAAAVKLAGFWREGSAVTDTGENLESPLRLDPDLPPDMRWSRAIMMTLASLRFSSPPAGARGLKELHGKLALYAKVIPASCEFRPDEIGRIKDLAGADCKLLKWEEIGGRVVITTQQAYVGWQRDLSEPSMKGHLVGAEGQRLPPWGWGTRGSGNSQTQTYRFEIPEWTVDRFVLDGHVTDCPEELVDFTIEDIPLP